MTVTGDTGAHNTKAVKRRYPVVTGLTLGTTKIEGRRPYLKPQGIGGKKTIVSKLKRCGF